MVDQKIIDRVKKLFRLSSSPNENEAAVALEKAYTLMREYNLSQADVSELNEVLVGSVVKFSRWRETLVNHICKLNLIVPAKAEKGYLFIGDETNVFLAGEMYTYLERAIVRIARITIRGNAKHTYRENFKLGMVYNIAQRIDRMIEMNNGWIRTEQRISEIKSIIASRVGQRGSCPKLTKITAAMVRGFIAAEKVSLSRQLNKKAELLSAGACG